MRILSTVLFSLSYLIIICQDVHRLKSYHCHKTDQTIIIDGTADEFAWQQTQWIEDFQNIENYNSPDLKTQVKFLWDDDYLYLYAKLSEPHIWATYRQRDEPLFLDDAFEIFIDPDGDGHTYYEFLFNAHNTVWDLLMVRPYRTHPSPQAVDHYNLSEIQSAVSIEGSLNDPTDIDSYWAIEVAIPLDGIIELDYGCKLPQHGTVWRINIARVDWTMSNTNHNYTKSPEPEQYWAWSPTGQRNLHMPEKWGYLIFNENIEAKSSIDLQDDEFIKQAMWNLYWGQLTYAKQYGEYTDDLNKLNLSNKISMDFSPKIYTTPFYFEIVHKMSKGPGFWILNHEGKMAQSTRLKGH